MTLKVMEKACNQCLFGPNKVVREGRKEEVLAQCARDDVYFVCHKSSIRDPSERAMCAGFHAALPNVGKLQRMARHLNLIAYIDPETGEKVRDA
jgi:hypothetical protein